MVQINFAKKQVNAKIVYYGPGMSGKTTNLEVIHQRAPDGNRGDLTSISTEGDRTLFFDFMPLDLGTVSGMRTCFQIYTVPGQVYYNSTRKLVLQGVDGVIFVADSSPNMMEENIESLRNLAENLSEYGRSFGEMPLVIQYNKRDVPGALSIDELESQLNSAGVPAFEAIANTGKGVFPTLKAIAATVLESLHKQQGAAAAAAPLPATEAREAPALAAAPVPVAVKPPEATPPAPVAQAPAAAAPAPAEGSTPLPPVPGAFVKPAPQPVAAQPEVQAPAAPLEPSLARPERPTISMSQTGFHEAPSVPLTEAQVNEPARPVPPTQPAAVNPQTEAPAPTSELSMAQSSPEFSSPTQPKTACPPSATPVRALRMEQPQPHAPQQTQPGEHQQNVNPGVRPRTPGPAQQRAMHNPAQTPVHSVPASTPETASSMMAVQAGETAPQRRVPGSRSFPISAPIPEVRPTPMGKKSALVTGVIVIVSVLTGAILGSFVLTIL